MFELDELRREIYFAERSEQERRRKIRRWLWLCVPVGLLLGIILKLWLVG